MSNQSAAIRNRQPKGVATGGQYAAEQKGEGGAVPLSPAPSSEAAASEPHDFRSALSAGHRQLTDQGVAGVTAQAYLVATASRQLAGQYLDHAKTAAERGHDGHSLGYIQSHRAVADVMKSATENTEDPREISLAVRRAKASLGSTQNLFQGFGPNAVTSITGETRQFLTDIEGFLDDTSAI
ncbi:hypothetical protein LG293_17555 (plasmid) [Citricoccus nitrophenolicus]